MRVQRLRASIWKLGSQSDRNFSSTENSKKLGVIYCRFLFHFSYNAIFTYFRKESVEDKGEMLITSPPRDICFWEDGLDALFPITSMKYN